MKPVVYKNVPANFNKYWTKEEDDKLRDMFLNTRKVVLDPGTHEEVFLYWNPDQLAPIFERTRGSIIKRLHIVGCLYKQDSGYYITGTNRRYASLGYNPRR